MKETIKTRIWMEIPEEDNPFAAATCYCHGYDVYGDILSKATWSEYLLLLFKGEKLGTSECSLFEKLAIALANPGPRDHSIQAAMNGGAGGSDNASSLMAAIAVGAGQFGGAHEVALAMGFWNRCGLHLPEWKIELSNFTKREKADVWPRLQHPPGFDPYAASCSTPIRTTLNTLSNIYSFGALSWLNKNRIELEAFSGCPLAMTGVAAAALHDLGFNPAEGEMLYMILRLPGAAAHALEQSIYGYRSFPFYKDAVTLTNDPDSTESIMDKQDEQS
jgi:citrate synthase